MRPLVPVSLSAVLALMALSSGTAAERFGAATPDPSAPWHSRSPAETSQPSTPVAVTSRR